MHKKNWYILQYKPNSHIISQQNLKRQGFNTFLPHEVVTKRKFSKTSKQLKPLFPGYMFVEFSKQDLSWTKINSTIGVSKLLITNRELISVNENLMQELIQRCDNLGKLLPPRDLQKGDEVKVVNSPFTKFITKIEQIDSKNRIWVLMDIMGRKSRIQLMPEQIQLC